MNRIGLGCTCQASPLGAVSKSSVEGFFIGQNKYVRNSRPTNIYVKPGEAPYKVIPANGNMGRVVSLNQTATWGKLDSNYWIFLEDSMYTVILSTPPPNGLLDAVGREVEKVGSFALSKILLPVALVVGSVLVAVEIGKQVIRKKVEEKVAHA